MLTSNEARQIWKSIFDDPMLSIGKLRDKAVYGQVTALRSVHWKLFLSYLPSLDSQAWPIILNRERGVYVDLRKKYAKSPNEVSSDITLNNPLSQDATSPWQQFFADSELRKLIQQDVERTFPDVPYFRTKETQERMLSVLFTYCKINQDVSYRQGMHELLAPILYVVDQDSIKHQGDNDNDVDDVMNICLSNEFVEHDAFVIFSAVMKYAKDWYQFNLEVFTRRQPANPNIFKSDTAMEAAKLTPIVEKCHQIHHLRLKTLDPALAEHLENLGIEPQLFGIRWIRLLFGREFRLSQLLTLWDGLFAEDPSLRLVDYIFISMMMRIRHQLLSSDDSDCLHLLMRYNSIESSNQDVITILQRAIYMRDNFSFDGGRQIIWEIAKENGLPVSEIPPRQSASSPAPSPSIDNIVNVAKGYLDTTGGALAPLMADIKRNLNTLQATAGFLPPGPVNVNVSSKASPSNVTRDLQMSKMLATAVDILEKELFGEKSDSDVAVVMALTGIKHIRDVLKGVVDEFNPTLLDSITKLPNPTTKPNPSINTTNSNSSSTISSKLLLSRRNDTPAEALPRVPFRSNTVMKPSPISVVITPESLSNDTPSSSDATPLQPSLPPQPPNCTSDPLGIL